VTPKPSTMLQGVEGLEHKHEASHEDHSAK
jgi:hypothetical protein